MPDRRYGRDLLQGSNQRCAKIVLGLPLAETCKKGLGLVAAGLLIVAPCTAAARDDGRYANSPLKQWFDSLRSAKGPCCSDADGEPTEYDTNDGSYWAPIDGVMTRVPPEAVVKGPNLYGHAMKWLYFEGGVKTFRCFIPGAGI